MRASTPNHNAMRLVAGLAYHRPKAGARLRFVDLLFVARAHRRRGHAARLLWELRQAPIELSVRKDNAPAIATYLALGLCATEAPTYAPDAAHLALRTTSYLRTRAKLECKGGRGDAVGPATAPRRAVEHRVAWDALTTAERAFLVDGTVATEGDDLSRAAATRLLRGQEAPGDPPDTRMRYALLWEEEDA
tara:strand:- start:1148 stop:1720 length:573 start_codon:yes stop_codon:yes gene_type:complete